MAPALLLAAALPAGAQEPPARPSQCHYIYTVWNVKAKRSLARRSVAKPYSQLTEDEKGPFGCTPCEEDQTEVMLSDGLRFKACREVAAQVREALENSLSEGQRIVSIVGYRPQMSKGPVDKHGDRTQLSNHSFGAAVDLNEEYNGLYNNCTAWGRICVLAKGGPYRPEHELSLKESSPAVKHMKKAGFEWGGKIKGRQKDFMHFSPTGY